MGLPCRTGVWVDGQFAWFTDREWQRRMEYGQNTLVTEVTMFHPRLNLTLFCQDVVDFNRPILVRRFHVTNHADQPREVRLFFHYDFHISGNGVGDTVYFDPFTNALIFYKDDRYFLAGGTAAGIPGITSWATGVKELRGAEGTWRDAEDGVLGRNMIAQGAIDGTIALHHSDIPANGSGVFIHWLIAGTSHDEVDALNDRDGAPWPGSLPEADAGLLALVGEQGRDGFRQPARASATHLQALAPDHPHPDRRGRRDRRGQRFRHHERLRRYLFVCLAARRRARQHGAR